MTTKQRTLPTRDHERVIAYFEAAGLDYAEWSRAYNMHFGYYGRGMNPFRLEPMLNALSEQVYRRLQVDSASEPLVLDLGCGLGTASRYMAGLHPDAQFVGATVTPWQVEEGNRLSAESGLENRVLLMEADYLHLPCRIESADAAFAIESACYARGKDKWEFIDALHGMLGPGGRFAIADCFLRHNGPLPRLVDKAYRRSCDCWALQDMAQLDLFTRSLERAGFEDVRVDGISWNVAPSVAHVPWIALKFLAKVAWRGELGNLHRERRNNVLAPVLGMYLGMNRRHFSYCIVSGRKAG